jgi:hypothetical protein
MEYRLRSLSFSTALLGVVRHQAMPRDQHLPENRANRHRHRILAVVDVEQHHGLLRPS